MPQQPQQNFDAMRQDAIRRSREMQRAASRRSHLPPNEPAQAPAQRSAELRDEASEAAASPPPEYTPPPRTSGTGMQGILSSLNLPDEVNSFLSDWNGEKMALAALLYLLYKEGADVSLLLALAYILL